MKLYFAVWSVVGLQRVVHPLNCVVLNMLLQHRVPVNQEPVGYSHSKIKVILKQIKCNKMFNFSFKVDIYPRVQRNTNLPPQTYFLMKMTPAATLTIMIMMTVITMGTDLEEWLSTCRNKSGQKQLEMAACEQSACGVLGLKRF